MPNSQTAEQIPDWMNEESDRASKQKEKGTTVNHTAPAPAKKAAASKPKKAEKPTVNRIPKGFQLDEDKALAWDMALPVLKRKLGKTGPELADEMVDLLLAKYSKHLNP